MVAFPGACHHTHCNIAQTWKKIIIRESQISNFRGWNHYKWFNGTIKMSCLTLHHYCMSNLSIQSVPPLQSTIIVGLGRNCTSSIWTPMTMGTFLPSIACCKRLSLSAVTTVCKAALWTWLLEWARSETTLPPKGLLISGQSRIYLNPPQ